MAIEQFQTVRDVADMLKIGEATVRRWIKDGELRAIDIGRGWRISPQDLDDFLNRHANRPHADEVTIPPVARPAQITCSPPGKRKID